MGTSIQSIIFKNYTKQQAENWMKKYGYKPIKEPHLYLKDGYIYTRRYRLHNPNIYKAIRGKVINDNITFLIGII